MVFVNLRMEGRGLCPDVVLWTPEKRFPFFRLTETPLCMPWLAPAGKTLLTVDIGCQVGDPTWTMPDEQLGEFCIEQLKPIVPDARQRYLGCRVLRTPVAYPVFARAYESDRQRFAAGQEIHGLYSVGRNAEFSHILWKTFIGEHSRKCAACGNRLRSPRTLKLLLNRPERRRALNDHCSCVARDRHSSLSH